MRLELRIALQYDGLGREKLASCRVLAGPRCTAAPRRLPEPNRRTEALSSAKSNQNSMIREKKGGARRHAGVSNIISR